MQLHPLLALAFAAAASATTPSLAGCSSSIGSADGPFANLYQSMGWCQQKCEPQGYPYFATTKGNECFCLNGAPQLDADAGSCDMPCSGYPSDKCGGDKFFSIYKVETPAWARGHKPANFTA
ncbi:hypothetical protein KEM52_001495 [Ascosphaera acerosa]|nr:hypothetical protein KEM52_001495 [Ascosphaera acerosa]